MTWESLAMESKKACFEKSSSYMDRGDAALLEEDVSKALEMYGRALRHAPTPALLLRRARALLRTGKHLDAEEDCHKAMVLDRRCAEAYVLRSKARRGMGRLEDAYEDVSEALKLDEHDPEAKREAAKLKKEMQRLEREKILLHQAVQGQRLELAKVHEACKAMKIVMDSKDGHVEKLPTKQKWVKQIEEGTRGCKDAQDLFRIMGGVNILFAVLSEDNLSVLKALYEACRNNVLTCREIANKDHLVSLLPFVSDRRTTVVSLVLKIFNEVKSVEPALVGQQLLRCNQARTLCLIAQRGPEELHSVSLSILAGLVDAKGGVWNRFHPFAEPIIAGSVRGCCAMEKPVVIHALSVLHACTNRDLFLSHLNEEYSVPGSGKRTPLEVLFDLIKHMSERASEEETEILVNGIEVVKRDFLSLQDSEVKLISTAMDASRKILLGFPANIKHLKAIEALVTLLPMLSHAPQGISYSAAQLLLVGCKKDMDIAYLLGDLGASAAVCELCIAEYSKHSSTYFKLMSCLSHSKSFQEYLKTSCISQSVAALLNREMKDDCTIALVDTLQKTCLYDADFREWLCSERSLLASQVKLWYSHHGATRKAIQHLLSILMESETTAQTLAQEFSEGQLIKLTHDIRANAIAERMKETGGASIDVANARGGHQLSMQEQQVEEASQKINLAKLAAYIKTLSLHHCAENFVLAEFASAAAFVGCSLAVRIPRAHTYILLQQPHLIAMVEQRARANGGGQVNVKSCNLLEDGFSGIPVSIDVLVCVQVWSSLDQLEKEQFFHLARSKLQRDGKIVMIEDDINVIGDISLQTEVAGMSVYAEPEVSVDHFAKVFFLP